MEDLIVLPQRETSTYVFSIDKVPAFEQALNSIPQEEIGFVQCWNAFRSMSLLFDSGDNKIYDYQPVWCLSVDFKPEHEQLKLLAQQESLFYVKDDIDNRSLLNQFFGSQEKDLSYYEYLNSIGK